jgi:hypothetical protein
MFFKIIGRQDEICFIQHIERSDVRLWAAIGLGLFWAPIALSFPIAMVFFAASLMNFFSHQPADAIDFALISGVIGAVDLMAISFKRITLRRLLAKYGL